MIEFGHIQKKGWSVSGQAHGISDVGRCSTVDRLYESRGPVAWRGGSRGPSDV